MIALRKEDSSGILVHRAEEAPSHMNHSLPRRTRKNDACLSRCSAALAGNPNVGKKHPVQYP